MSSWALQDAKARFSEVINNCLHEGPQLVTRRGEKTAVIIPFDLYKKLTAPEESLSGFFCSAPRIEYRPERSQDLPRDVEL